MIVIGKRWNAPQGKEAIAVKGKGRLVITRKRKTAIRRKMEDIVFKTGNVIGKEKMVVMYKGDWSLKERDPIAGKKKIILTILVLDVFTLDAFSHKRKKIISST